MKLSKVIFLHPIEPPKSRTRLHYLQTTDPARRDSYVASIEGNSLGVMTDGEFYPWAVVRQATTIKEDHLEGIPWASETEHVPHEPKRRGRPPKLKENDPTR